MPPYQALFDLIDMRSFSNLWFWIGLAVFWSAASHRVLGVPHDMLRHALSDDQARTLADVETLAAINARRLLHLSRRAGVPIVAVLSFGLGVLAVLALFYGAEFAQALLCFFLPCLAIIALTHRTARHVVTDAATGPALVGLLRRHRQSVQALGMVAVTLTAIFGMYQNLLFGIYG